MNTEEPTQPRIAPAPAPSFGDAGVGAGDLLTALSGIVLDPDIGLRRRCFPARLPLAVLGDLGIPDNAIRMALSRQVTRGHLSRRRDGRHVVYTMTEVGERLTGERGLRVRGPSPFAPESVVWTLVSFTVPESRRDIRSRLRLHLTGSGFRALRDGLWIALDAAPAEDLIRDLDPDLAAHSELDVFIATPHLSVGLADLLQRVWDVPDLRRRHEKFLSRWEHLTVPTTHPLSVLTLMVAEWVSLLQHDPGLPAAPLGGDWPGPRSAAAAARVFSLLQQPATSVLEDLLGMPE